MGEVKATTGLQLLVTIATSDWLGTFWAVLHQVLPLCADLLSTTGCCENDRPTNPTRRLKLKQKDSLLPLTCSCHGSLFSTGRKCRLLFKER